MNEETQNLLDTSKRIFHVFSCEGRPSHISSGFALLVSGNGLSCPTCHKGVKDITDTPLGKAYFAFGRPDLGRSE
jgi:hypothetical protein